MAKIKVNVYRRRPKNTFCTYTPFVLYAVNLREHADYFKRIKTKDLKKSLLPQEITYNGKIITAPDGWLPT
ncbi:MAG: hypothetical protein LBN21_12795 [Treponema sp.]|jgi:hypothetical protein|nr:hypothetical protein [Treponema sp.]